ncbi:hypothetical protein [Catenulispora rubra]|uniref:hypothetical protein n=1 Tax=Catenulispora rubra TaxID=280293 RepID=UPI0018923E43|nr:hypothetical protein [Catenulispora rubra]
MATDPTQDPHFQTVIGGTTYCYDYTDKKWYQNQTDSMIGSWWVSSDPPANTTPPATPPSDPTKTSNTSNTSNTSTTSNTSNTTTTDTQDTGPWSPNHADRQPDKPLPKDAKDLPKVPAPPPVPGGDGTGNTSVDTPSLDKFASNIALLQDPVNKLLDTITQMPAVQPGAFYHADQIRANIDGLNGDGGLKQKYRTAVTDLTNGLKDLHDAMTSLSTKYASTEDANKGTADDVNRALNGSTAYFSGIDTDVSGGSSNTGA